MKSLKLAMIATFIALTMVSSAYAGNVPGTHQSKVIYLSLQQAVQDPGLVAAIYQQVSLKDILVYPSLTYTANVMYQGYLVKITGSQDQWVLLFKYKDTTFSIVSSNTIKGN